MTDPIRGSRLAEWAFALLMFAAVNLTMAAFQPRVEHNGGKGWDGAEYYAVAEQMAEGSYPVRAGAPWVYRVGTPLLASHAPDILQGFLLVNVAGNLLTTVLLVVWLRSYVQSGGIRMALVTLWLTHWLANPRFVYFYPAVTDCWAMAFALAGLIVLRRVAQEASVRNVAVLAAITAVGVLFREVVLLVGVCALFVRNPLCKRASLRHAGVPWLLLLPLAAGLASLALVRVMAEPTNTYVFSIRAAYYFMERILANYLLAFAFAFGPALFLVLYNARAVGRMLWREQFVLAFAAMTVGMAYVGGDDLERYLLFGAPVFYMLLGRTLEEHREWLRSPLLLSVLLPAQALAHRLFFTVPQTPEAPTSSVPVLTPLSNSYFELLANYASRRVRGLALFEYVMLGLLLFALLRRASAAAKQAHQVANG